MAEQVALGILIAVGVLLAVVWVFFIIKLSLEEWLGEWKEPPSLLH